MALIYFSFAYCSRILTKTLQPVTNTAISKKAMMQSTCDNDSFLTEADIVIMTLQEFFHHLDALGPDHRGNGRDGRRHGMGRGGKGKGKEEGEREESRVRTIVPSYYRIGR